MRTSLAVALALVGSACATTYNLPPEERSRSFEASQDVVWEAALAAFDDLSIAVVLAEREHGQILGRTKGSIWDLKGHSVRIIVTDAGQGRTRIDANSETVSDDSIVDFGKAKGIVRDFLNAVEDRVAETRGADPLG